MITDKDMEVTFTKMEMFTLDNGSKEEEKEEDRLLYRKPTKSMMASG